MIDRNLLNAIQELNQFAQQRRGIIRAFEEASRVSHSADIPLVKVGRLQTMTRWSDLTPFRLNLPDTSGVRKLLQYTHDLSHFYIKIAPTFSGGAFFPLFYQSMVEIFVHTRSIEGLFPKSTPMMVREATPEEEQKQRAIEQVTEETKSDVEQWLQQLHPALYSMWQGARQTLVSDNPDRVRHVMVSLRTLLDHVINRLAPKDKVRAWSTDPLYYRENGKTPNGRGQIFYICRNISSGDDSFAQFLDADVNAIVSLWISFNSLHKLEQTVSDIQLRIMVERFESALLLLIRASETNEE